jgi:hypothetical protein
MLPGVSSNRVNARKSAKQMVNPEKNALGSLPGVRRAIVLQIVIARDDRGQTKRPGRATLSHHLTATDRTTSVGRQRRNDSREIVFPIVTVLDDREPMKGQSRVTPSHDLVVIRAMPNGLERQDDPSFRVEMTANRAMNEDRAFKRNAALPASDARSSVPIGRGCEKTQGKESLANVLSEALSRNRNDLLRAASVRAEDRDSLAREIRSVETLVQSGIPVVTGAARTGEIAAVVPDTLTSSLSVF